MSATIFVNVSANDSPKSSSPADFVELNLTYDKLIFSAGSDVVKDGEVIPSSQQLNSAGVLILNTDVEISKFFVADYDANLLKEIHNAGNQNKRYVFCVSFDVATASEPVLELWDNDDLNTIDFYSLGEGTANDSFFRGITTTSALPGVGWTGKRLAGSSDNHFLFLNDLAGELTGAKDLYFNLRVTIPANFANASAENPVFVIKYTSN